MQIMMGLKSLSSCWGISCYLIKDWRFYNILLQRMAVKEALIASGEQNHNIAVVIVLLWASGAFHVIDSGHIGVYKRGGALLNSWT